MLSAFTLAIVALNNLRGGFVIVVNEFTASKFRVKFLFLFPVWFTHFFVPSSVFINYRQQGVVVHVILKVKGQQTTKTKLGNFTRIIIIMESSYSSMCSYDSDVQ